MSLQSCSPPMTAKTISWNRKAIEQAKAQGFENPAHAICPICGTTPALRQFGPFQCECGELEGFEQEGGG